MSTAYYHLSAFIPQFVDQSGNPLVGGTINAYLAGTTTPEQLYTDLDGTSAGTVVSLNSRGYPTVSGNVVQLCGKKGTSYKVVLKDSTGATVYTADNIGDVRVTLGGAFYVVDFGAVGDGITDDSAAIQDAYAALQAAGSGTLYYEPGATYLITSGAYIESANSDDPNSNIGPFYIEGNGATITMTAAFSRGSTAINSVLTEAITFAGVKKTIVKNLHFVGTGTSLSTATTSNCYNVADPGHKGAGVRVQGYQDFTFENCTFTGLSLGIVLNDDDPRVPLPIPVDKPIDSYIYTIERCKFYHCWQALSFTYGGSSRGQVVNNYFESCVTKLISHYGTSKTTRQLAGANHVITGNIWKNCPAVIVGLSDCHFHHNILDNVVGGVWVNPGSDHPTTNFLYDIHKLKIENNILNYTESWTTDAESDMVPICALFVGLADAYVAAQTVTFHDLSFSNNSINTSCISSSVAGVILLSTTDADSIFQNLEIVGNEITTTDSNGTMIYGAAYPGATIQYTGRCRVTGNTFRREANGSGGNSNVEITLGSTAAMNPSRTNTLEFSDNHYHGNAATNSILVADRFSSVRLNNNDLFTGDSSGSYIGSFKLRGCPVIFASKNRHVKGATDKGVLISYCVVDSSDQASMDAIRIKTDNNYLHRGIAGVSPVDSFTFGGSAYGLIESVNDTIGNPAYKWHPTIANVDSNCVVNPTRRNLASGSYISYTNALTVVPEGYSVRTTLTGTGDATGFRLTSSAWKAEGTLP